MIEQFWPHIVILLLVVIAYRLWSILDVLRGGPASRARARSSRRQTLRTRFFWFMAGSVANYLLILTPFKWLKAHTDLPTLAIAACSMGVSASFFFVWNYFINFRGDSRKRDALPRYLTAVLVMFVLSTNLLAYLKQHDAHMAFSVGRIALDLDIVATQFFLAGLKFFLYHKWVFPLPKDTT